jgi:hypothetical protein
MYWGKGKAYNITGHEGLTALDGGRWTMPRHGRSTPPPPMGKWPGIRCAGPVWTGAENLAPTGFRSPDRPVRSESLYRLSYPGPHLYHSIVGKSGNLNLCVIQEVIMQKHSFTFNPLSAELSPICHLLTLFGAHHILHVSGLRVKFICR